MKKFYNIEGMIRNGFKLSRDYETLDFSFANFSDAAAESLAKARSIKQLKRLTISGKKLTSLTAKEPAQNMVLSNVSRSALALSLIHI